MVEASTTWPTPADMQQINTWGKAKDFNHSKRYLAVMGLSYIMGFDLGAVAFGMCCIRLVGACCIWCPLLWRLPYMTAAVTWSRIGSWHHR